MPNHRREGLRRQEERARRSRYHTENRGYWAATSFSQRASLERVIEPVKVASFVTHLPGLQPGPLIAAPEIARDADQPPSYRTVVVLSAGISLGGGSAVIALPTSPSVDATLRSTSPSKYCRPP
jgi:hypothetical protein